MSTLALRQKLIAIAAKAVGQTESTRNRGPAMKRFWPASAYVPPIPVTIHEDGTVTTP